MNRRGQVKRDTAETQIRLALDLDGGKRSIDVPGGFFAHMLDALATHSGLGPLVEALGDRRGITRFAHAYAPLDEALARAVVDVSGRGFLACNLPDDLEHTWVTQEFPLSLIVDFFHAFADRGRLTLHVDVLSGRNGHHAAEAAFKAVALALRQAVAIREGEQQVPSTKGTLTA